MTTLSTQPVAALSDALLERVAWLDLSDAQDRVARGADPDAPYHVVSMIGVEYRRFLLLRLAYPQLSIPAPPLIDGYWRLHATDAAKFAADCDGLVAGTALSPEALTPPPQSNGHSPSEQIQELYGTVFPCGNADLWGWPPPASDRRDGATGLGSVHVRFPSALDDSTTDALRREASEQRTGARELKSTGAQIERGSVSGGFGRFCYAPAGPVASDKHWNGSVSRLIAAHSGAIVVPTGAYYNYYRSGDFISIHTDPYGNELVLLTLVSGPVESLHGHLDLADTPLAEIASLAQATDGLPPGGTRFEISSVPLLFSGHRIPHHRPPAERDEEVVLLAQFFACLLPSRSTRRSPSR